MLSEEMDKIKCILVDDQDKMRYMLREHITEYCPALTIIDEFETPQEAAQFLRITPVDIVFLDIEMGSETGFDLIPKIDRRNQLPLIIMATAYEKYALQAIRSSAFDYILKPIDSDELVRAVNKSIQEIERIHARSKSEYKIKPTYSSKLKIATQAGLEIIDQSDIICMIAARNYTEINLKNKIKIIASKPLSHFEEKLNPKIFFRSHRSNIINIHTVQAWRSEDGGYLELDEGLQAKIIVSKKDTLLNLLDKI